MDKVKPPSSSWDLPPLRSLNDFLLESSRFQLPNFKDFEKWGNRVANNLVYYQTNYLYLCIAIILVTASVNPMKMIIGVLSLSMMWAVYIFAVDNSPSLNKVKQTIPRVDLILLIVCLACIVYNRHSVLFLLLAIFLSLSVIFIHASLRLRNIKNKLANKIDGLGLQRTPMGIILSYIEYTTGITLRTQTTVIQSLH